MATDKKREQLAIGYLGEQLVGQWLQQQGWQLVAQGWHSRWGELDIVARQPREAGEEWLAFVEVKTRSRGNLDAGGLLAITPVKQVKLWKTAQAFLAKHPHLAELPCRFDVALVRCVRRPSAKMTSQVQTDDCQRLRHPSAQTEMLTQSAEPKFPRDLALGQTITVAHYSLTLLTYLEAAFSG
ncbi:MAG: YraN family protein [Cyanobacteria bacterium P01_A01_bin.17]